MRNSRRNILDKKTGRKKNLNKSNYRIFRLEKAREEQVVKSFVRKVHEFIDLLTEYRETKLSC